VSVRLACPLCGHVVADGVDHIAPGACPGCGARYAGGEPSAADAVRTALAAFGAEQLDPGAVTDAVFRLTPADSAARGVAVTSDERDGFYLWWLFVRHGDDDGPAAVIAALLPG
jgi:predicted  nucleic acid-binding Zn-ribbon protein